MSLIIPIYSRIVPLTEQTLGELLSLSQFPHSVLGHCSLFEVDTLVLDRPIKDEREAQIERQMRVHQPQMFRMDKPDIFSPPGPYHAIFFHHTLLTAFLHQAVKHSDYDIPIRLTAAGAGFEVAIETSRRLGGDRRTTYIPYAAEAGDEFAWVERAHNEDFLRRAMPHMVAHHSRDEFFLAMTKYPTSHLPGIATLVSDDGRHIEALIDLSRYPLKRPAAVRLTELAQDVALIDITPSFVDPMAAVAREPDLFCAELRQVLEHLLELNAGSLDHRPFPWQRYLPRTI